MHVVTFEIETPYHSAARALAVDNGVADRLTLRGPCTTKTLGVELASARRPMVPMDCEGAKDSLLNSEQVPDLRRVLIVCEIHDAVVPGVTERMRARFAATHAIEIVPTVPRVQTDAAILAGLSPDAAAFALSEGRGGPTHWLVMKPNVV